jgi:ABC-type Fe3+/spermidine/putrescine transport system ATPase subunit
MDEPYLQLKNLTKRFGNHVAIEDLSLGVERGSVLALLGPSGSGKTTTLRLLAGFETPDAGSIVVDGTDVTRLPPVSRRFGMVFQHYALFPHLTVEKNVSFGLTGRPPAERDKRVAEVLHMVDLAEFGAREVTALSGGQQQRVAVARALAPEPSILLLDEPLSNLDPGLRERTRAELRMALEDSGVTTVFVTHEQEEAFALGDQVAVIHQGALQQVGTAPELYEQPATEFVATFVGRASVMPGVMADEKTVTIANQIQWPAESLLSVNPGDDVRVVVRPEAFAFTSGTGLSGRVVDRRYTGARAYFQVETEVGTLEIEASVHATQVGDSVMLSASRTRVYRSEHD